MKQRGFTLLEVMIALAILGASLIVLLRLATSDIRATHRAKLLTIATGLARGKMLDVEEELKRNGFQDSNQEQEGDFSEEEQPKFTWHALIEKVELPESGQLAEGGANGKPTGSNPPPSPEDEANQNELLGLSGGSATGALGAGMVQLYFPMIRPVLENAIRKVTLEIHWKTGGEEEKLKVIAFFTNTKAIDQAVGAQQAATGGAGQVPAAPGGGAAGVGGQGGPGGAGGAPGGTTR